MGGREARVEFIAWNIDNLLFINVPYLYGGTK